jgi:hypothetical protein
VFWISDDDFAEKPLCLLSELYSQIQESLVKQPTTKCDDSFIMRLVQSFCSASKESIAIKSKQWGMSNLDTFKKTKFAVFGPWSSTTLKTLLKETKTIKDKKEIKESHLVFYNVFATASSEILLDGLPNKEMTIGDRLSFILEKKNVFYYTTCSDSVLASAMREELMCRGVDLKNDLIAFIAENDTVYGRALPKTFRYGFVGDNPANIERFTYLRGLDGRSPQENSTSLSGTSTHGNTPGNNPRMSIESRFMPSRKTNRPEGNNQFDYIIRLGEDMRQMEHQKQKRFKVIGILGSDLYDKLLLLQALRPQFPNALFFTTDLDASYNHPQELEWTKNLLIASTHGLTLDEYYQCGAAPFRFSYQTAVFQAILGATTKSECEDEKRNLGKEKFPPCVIMHGTCISQCKEKLKHEILLTSSPARIFEVGWDKAYDLSTPADIHPKRMTAHESSSMSFGWSIIWYFVCIPFDVYRTIVGFLSGDIFHRDIAGKINGYRYANIVMTILCVLLITLYALMWHRKIFRLGRFIWEHTFGIFFPIKHQCSGDGSKSTNKQTNNPDDKPTESDNQGFIPAKYKKLFIGVLLIAAICFICVYAGIVHSDHCSSLGEHWYLGAGISAWPSTTLRLIVCIASVSLICYAISRAKKMREKLCEDYQLKKFGLWGPNESGDIFEHLKELPKRLRKFFGDLFNQNKTDQEQKDQKSIHVLWETHCEEVLPRVLIDTVIWVAASTAVLFLLVCDGNGHLPYRGEASYVLGSSIWAIAWITTLLLTLTTFFITRSCYRFIKKMEKTGIVWGEIKNLPDLFIHWNTSERRYVAPLIDVTFVETWTQKISNLVLYPVVSIVLLFVAESAYFDNYGYNPYRYIVLFLMGLLIFAPAFQLRSAAIRLKRKKIREARQKLEYNFRGREPNRKKIKFAIQETENLKEGAFQPFLEHPFMQAILVLLGGVSLPTFLSQIHLF